LSSIEGVVEDVLGQDAQEAGFVGMGALAKVEGRAEQSRLGLLECSGAKEVQAAAQLGGRGSLVQQAAVQGLQQAGRGHNKPGQPFGSWGQRVFVEGLQVRCRWGRRVPQGGGHAVETVELMAEQDAVLQAFDVGTNPLGLVARMVLAIAGKKPGHDGPRELDEVLRALPLGGPKRGMAMGSFIFQKSAGMRRLGQPKPERRQQAQEQCRLGGR
jgi:hypothetical protein